MHQKNNIKGSVILVSDLVYSRVIPVEKLNLSE